jgi:hypothetical protein
MNYPSKEDTIACKDEIKADLVDSDPEGEF